MEAALHHSTSLYLAAGTLGAPLLAFGLIMLAIRSRHRLSAAVSTGAATLSLAGAVILLVRHWSMTAPIEFQSTWVVFGQMTIPVGFLLDSASLLMLAVVATISLLVQVYSLGYMAGDPGFGRYYGCMSLFAWAMLSLTVSGSLLQLYIFWELVGLASYLLIGFWFEKFSASEAGKKAFVMTRVGDVSFLLGVVLLWLHLGGLEIRVLNDPQAVRAHLDPCMVTLCALLVFGGIVGKSAQFPLLTWLPDAMEGPTPVSALLHSATMVAAGIYLFARLFGFFSMSPAAMAVCLAIGTVSMLLASSMALVARDIKQVWAFSTISQLGYMLMGLGAGSLSTGMFHLITHAGFKALLFLCAGLLIHHYGTNDIFELAQKGGRRLKTAAVGLLVGAGALSGLPPLSGFFSKELILGHLLALDNPLWFLAGAAGAFLTTYYSFRLIFILMLPPDTGRPALAENPHSHQAGSGDWAMNTVLWCLTAVTLTLGFWQSPVLEALGRATGAPAGGAALPEHHWLPVAACLLAAVAIALAWFEFGRRGSARIGWAERLDWTRDLFSQRWYLDRLYRVMLDVLVYRGVSRLFTANDRRVVDGAVDGVGKSAVALGRVLARLHLGMIQYRLMAMFVGVILLAIYIGWGD